MGEWDSSRLAEVAQIAKGRVLPTSSARLESNVRYLGAADLEGGDSGLYAPPSNAVLCDNDDVLMLWDGERSGLVGCGLSGAVSSTVARIRPIRAKVASKYLYHHLRSRFGEIQSLRTGTGVPHVPRDLQFFVKLPVPTLEEQRRIAEVLDTIDETIQATERIIAKKGMELRGLAAHLMSSSSPFREWDQRQLGTWTQPGCPITYGIVQAGPHVPNGIPYIRTGDMGTELRIEGLLRTSPRIAQSYARSRVSAGDIVCAIRATVGKVLLVPPELDGANLTQGTARIAPGLNTDRWCLLWVLRSEEVKAQIRAVQKGTTFQEITLRQLRSIVARLPARLSDQRRFAAPLNALDTASRTEQLALNKLRELRAGLAADLLSGRVRTVSV